MWCNLRIEALNSLCGISSNATEPYVLPPALWDLNTLNSLCGISSNATVSEAVTPSAKTSALLSIPFVGFLRMQRPSNSLRMASEKVESLNSLCGFSSNATVGHESTAQLLTEILGLSIPFVGFLRMQLTGISIPMRRVSIMALSIPFVGFLRMQQPPLREGRLERGE